MKINLRRPVSPSSGERGQGLAEYTIVLSLVGVAALAGMAFLGGALKSKITALTGSVVGVSEEEIERQEQSGKKAFAGAVKSSSSVSGMKIETRGDGKETLDEESLR